MSVAGDRFHADETSHLILDEIDDSEVLSYVQQRRASIATAGTTHIPQSFVLNRKHSRTFLDGASSHGLHSTKSNALGLHSDVGDLLSIHSHAVPPEPETDLKTETLVLLKYSSPMIVTFLLQYSLTVASVFSVGRLGSTELAAISLCSMTSNISGYAIVQGVATCLDTLCAQAFGRKDYNSVGLHFVRCTYLLFLLYIPMFILWMFLASPVLSFLLGSGNERVVELASDYLRVLSLGIPGYIVFESCKHFLQSQGIFHASTYVLLVCAPLNAFLNYLLVWNGRFGMGFLGAPLSVVITNWLMCFLLLLYILFVRGHECLPKEHLFHPVFFQNWSKMVNLSIPGVLMIEAEWLAFEIITFTAASFGTEVLAAQSVVATTGVIFYQIPFALSIAGSTRVAWYIGAASKKAATVAANLCLLVSLVIGFICGFVLYAFRDFCALLFSNDPEVLKVASKVLIVGAIYQFNDFLSCAASGVLRGQGRQKIGGIINLVSYYLIALPAAFLFAFYFELELIGLWFGMIIALLFSSASQTYYVITSDWDHIINECINESILEDGNLNIDAHSLVPSMSSAHIV